MTQLTSFARAAWCTTVVLALASACGGQSFQGGEGGDAGSGGATNTGGTRATGGSKASGGSSTTAGTHSAGSGSTAGTGAGGEPSACTGPSDDSLDGSSCSAYFMIWTHNAATGICEPSAYGGCGATKNNYPTLAACQEACHGGNPNYDSCKVASDCALGATGCCGVCDGPGVSAHDFIAYNKQYASQTQQCAGDVACGACPPVDTQNTRPYFVPDCVRGECVVQDIRESDVTACKTAEDCRLRNGTGCCESCSGNDLVAVSNDGSLEKLVCGGILPPCAACEALPPSGTVAICGLSGHCEIGYLLDK
jgi:hypothetical protein